MWVYFREYVADLILNKNIKYFFKLKISPSGKKFLVYFSKTASWSGGYPRGIFTDDHYLPFKEIFFEKDIKKNIFIKKIIKDLDLSSYWLYINKKLENYYFYKLDCESLKINFIDLQDILIKKNKINLKHFYLKNKQILKIYKKLSILGFCLFFKRGDKKS